MRMYRTGWLVVGIALLLVGVGAAAHASPRALLIVFVVVAVACSLVSLSAIGIRKSARPRRVRGHSVATRALVGGTIAVALVGFAALSGSVSGYSLSSSWSARPRRGRLRPVAALGSHSLSSPARRDCPRLRQRGCGVCRDSTGAGPARADRRRVEPKLARQLSVSAAAAIGGPGDASRWSSDRSISTSSNADTPVGSQHG